QQSPQIGHESRVLAGSLFLAQKKCFVTAHVCYAHPSSCHAGVCDVAEGFCATAAGLPAASRFPTGRMRMDDIEFHGEPPSNIPTMVVAFGGWVDAGDAATGTLRSLVRQLAATPLATIDPEAFVDFTTIRPVVRLTAEGERTIRWPRIAFWTWQPPDGGAGLLLLRGVQPQLRWRTYATLLLDVAARCGVQRLMSLGAVLAAVPHTCSGLQSKLAGTAISAFSGPHYVHLSPCSGPHYGSWPLLVMVEREIP